MNVRAVPLIVAAIVGALLFFVGTADGGGYPHPTTTQPAHTSTTVAGGTTTVVGTNPLTVPTEVTTSTTSAPTTTTTLPASTSTSTTTQPTSSSVAPTTTTSSLPSSTTLPPTSTVPTTSTTSTTQPLPSSSTVSSTTTTSSTSTTSSSTTSSTSTLPDTFTFGAAGTVCVREVPTIRITFENRFPSLAGVAGTLTMRDINGNVVSVQPLVYQPGATVDILYPGTSVNPDGSVADVPGWTLNDDGFWVLDPSDEILRRGISLTYTVNPTAGPVLISYPPESSECANPSGPFPPTTTVVLPVTR